MRASKLNTRCQLHKPRVSNVLGPVDSTMDEPVASIFSTLASCHQLLTTPQVRHRVKPQVVKFAAAPVRGSYTDSSTPHLLIPSDPRLQTPDPPAPLCEILDEPQNLFPASFPPPPPPRPSSPPPPFLPLALPNVNFSVGEPLLLSHCLLTLRCHGMRSSRLHQGLRFLAIRCGFRVSGLRFRLSGLGFRVSPW